MTCMVKREMTVDGIKSIDPHNQIEGTAIPELFWRLDNAWKEIIIRTRTH